jgi:hypothetical protein
MKEMREMKKCQEQILSGKQKEEKAKQQKRKSNQVISV